jgi:glycosyltransferase involved in cell wall biosynthesis
MKIFFIAPLSPPLTGQSVMNDATLNFLKNNNDVLILNLSSNSLSSHLSIKKFLINIQNFFKIIIFSNKCDVIYFNISESFFGNLRDLFFFLLLGFRLKKTYLHLHGGTGYISIISRYKFFKVLNKFFLRQAAGVIVLDEIYKNFLINTLGLKNLHVLPNHAEKDLFLNSSQIKHKFSNNNNKLKVIFLSNFLEGKGYLEILDAYKSLSKIEQKNILIDFAGNFISEKDRLVFFRSIQPFKSLNYVGLISEIQEKRNFLSQAHVLCLPTYYPYEGQPIAILEAYAAGCAVITTNHASIPNLAKNNINGYIVEKGSSIDLASAFRNSLNNMGKLEDFGLVNNKIARKNFTFNSYIRSFSNILKLNN